MSHPRLNPSLLLSPLQDGYVVYDPASDQLHELNPLAALIAELCDGSRSVDEVRELVAPLLPDGAALEVDRVIADAVKSGLFTANGATANAREFSSDDLAKLAARLRNNGKVQTAFLCQQRAAEMDPINADKWCYLGELAHILGRRDEARAAYEKYLALEPGDAEVQLILVALRDQPPPPRVPDECIQQLYERFSQFYEQNVVDDLGYQGPQRIAQMVESIFLESGWGDRHNLAMLDLGCGSGLAGMRFKPRLARLVGVDLSPEMVELARARNIYDVLEVAEITHWLENCIAHESAQGKSRGSAQEKSHGSAPDTAQHRAHENPQGSAHGSAPSHERFDLATACDSLIYFGDVSEVTRLVAGLLTPGGIFAMTLERGERFPFHLSDSGRYTHHPNHIREAAAQAGLEVARLEEDFLRMEYGTEVTGLFAVLQKKA